MMISVAEREGNMITKMKPEITQWVVEIRDAI